MKLGISLSLSIFLIIFLTLFLPFSLADVRLFYDADAPGEDIPPGNTWYENCYFAPTAEESSDAEIKVNLHLLALQPLEYITGLSALVGTESDSGFNVSVGVYDSAVNSSCIQGVEGQYYLRMDAYTGAWSATPSEGFCFMPAPVVNYDTYPDRYCKTSCIGGTKQPDPGVSGCCGDDGPADCLFASGNYVCADLVSKSSPANRWQWLLASDYVGGIFKPQCSKASLLGTPEGFRACGPQSNLTGTVSFYLLISRNVTNAETGAQLEFKTKSKMLTVPYSQGSQQIADPDVPSETLDILTFFADVPFPGTPVNQTLKVSSSNDLVEVFFEGGGNSVSASPAVPLVPTTMIMASITRAPSEITPTGDTTTIPGLTSGGIPKTHEYACVMQADGTGRIYECAGADNAYHQDKVVDDPEWSRNMGYDPILNEGGFAQSGDFKRYCIDDGTKTYFSETLEDPEACDSAFAADVTKGWTGNTCCGEEPAEFYNDDGGVAGCWNSRLVRNSETVPGESQRVIAINGNLGGCNIDKLDPTNIRNVKDTEELKEGRNTRLVEDYAQCEVLVEPESGAAFQCSIQNMWQPTLRADRSYYKNVSFLKALGATWQFDEFGCCNASECWNSTGCVQDQTGKPVYSSMEGYVCLAGKWSKIPYFYTPYGDRGYCASADKCLYNPNPNSTVNCLDSKKYQMQFYCDSGKWTTRTKNIAMYLLNFANQPQYRTNFTLYCDKYENILTYYPYTFEGVSVSEYLGTHCMVNGESGLKPCVNNFCVLTYPGGTAFGASLNMPINDPDRSFLKAFNYNANSCNSVADFGKCGTTNAYYDKGLNMMFYIPQGTLAKPSSVDGVFTSSMQIPLNRILEITNAEGVFDQKFKIFSSASMFNRLFVDSHGSRVITAFLEESRPFFDEAGTKLFNVDYLAADMQGHSIDACKVVSGYPWDYTCDTDNIAFAKTRTSAPASESDFAPLWLDLTSKLRAR